MALARNVSDLTNDTEIVDLDAQKWTYGLVIPLTSSFGIVGNALILGILFTADKRFTGFIYAYIKGLAFVDLIQLIFTLQV